MPGSSDAMVEARPRACSAGSPVVLSAAHISSCLFKNFLILSSVHAVTSDCNVVLLGIPDGVGVSGFE